MSNPEIILCSICGQVNLDEGTEPALYHWNYSDVRVTALLCPQCASNVETIRERTGVAHAVIARDLRTAVDCGAKDPVEIVMEVARRSRFTVLDGGLTKTDGDDTDT